MVQNVVEHWLGVGWDQFEPEDVCLVALPTIHLLEAESGAEALVGLKTARPFAFEGQGIGVIWSSIQLLYCTQAWIILY